MPPEKQPRIVFHGNPWPTGHAVAELAWRGHFTRESGLFFDFHLVTADYYADDMMDDDDDAEPEDAGEGDDDWTAKMVWANYHKCTLSSDFWGRGGVRVGTAEHRFDIDRVANRELRADPLPVDFATFDETKAFGIYLLGHDSAADHRIKFGARLPTGEYPIVWSGKIALTYGGDEEFKHTFEAKLPRVKFEGFKAPDGATEPDALAILSELVTDPSRYAVVRRKTKLWLVPH